MYAPSLRRLFCLILLIGTATGHADDTDLFNQPPGSTSPNPNILFILDNTPNWDRASQQWEGSPKQGDAEILAIKNFVKNLTKPANVGLMMFTTTGQRGGYVRFGIRDMTVAANNTAWQNLVSSIVVTDSKEKINVTNEGGPISTAFYEAWRYLRGTSSWAGMDDLADYAGNTNAKTAAGQGLTSGFAYRGSDAGAYYRSPLGADCAKTYIIFIGNNGPNAQLDSPSSTSPAVTTLKTYKYTSTPDIQSAWARFLHLRPDLTAGSVEAAQGSVTTYTIDAYNRQQTASYTTALKNMARNGGGQYFQAGSDAALTSALNNILAQIQAVNSVFASASLPVSVSVRGTYLNQVYLGVFRPDARKQPYWTGNLKQYKLGADTTVTPPAMFLADSTGAAAENPTTGFVTPSAVSFWTQPSTFWNPDYFVDSQGLGGSSDSPDGDLVEKGGAAQYVRTTFATDQSTRKVYTCTGSCAPGSQLSTTPFSTTNASITSTLLGAASSTERDAIINWVRGGNVNLDDPANATGSAGGIRGFVHGDVLHSRPAVINYNRNADDVVVFYGSNDGMLHAVKGGQETANGDGQELWTFIAPEHFNQFKRLRDRSPTIDAANPKPYFLDGSPTVYTYSSAGDGKINAARGDKAYLFIPMRRGGRFMYALDVSDPAAPKLLWKKSSSDTGFAELGESWSDMRVAKLRATSDPVLIFGLGNDSTANDPVVQGTATRGRGVMVVNATNGTPIWQAGPSPAGATYNKTVSGMTFAIPASVALYDANSDGKTDRIYAVDTGANIWRINVNDASPANWTVTKLAQLGGTGADARKFLYPPDIIRATPGNDFDTLLLGSGDREHPFDTTIRNRYYMIKDSHDLNDVRATPITESDLYDTTDNLIQVGSATEQATAQTALSNAQGWYVRLGTGEKVVGGSTTLAGTVIFGTNTPTAVAANACVGNLGEARDYALNYLNGAATIDKNRDGTLRTTDRYAVRNGGGFPPTPIPISVRIDGRTYQGAISGTKVITPPGPPLGRRYRTYWHKNID